LTLELLHDFGVYKLNFLEFLDLPKQEMVAWLLDSFPMFYG